MAWRSNTVGVGGATGTEVAPGALDATAAREAEAATADGGCTLADGESAV